MKRQSDNIVWHHGTVRADDRGRILGQRGCVVWITGLSGSGKSTLARAAEADLVARGHLAYVLDGDNIRHRLNADLGFSPADRKENIRRVGEVAALFADAGVITLTAFISPYREDREAARALVPEGRFIEVFLDVPLAECERRDPKELYKKARAGEIPEFTGISAPFEAPESSELTIPTAELDLKESVALLHSHLAAGGFLTGPTGCSTL